MTAQWLSEDSDQEVKQFAEAILAAQGWTLRRQRCEALVRGRSGEALEAFADAVKSQEIDDGRLHTQLAEARILALALQLLGAVARRPHIDALGLLARGDVTRQRGRNAKALVLYDRAAEGFLAADDRVGWARARSGRLLAATYAGDLSEGDWEEMDVVRQVLREAGQWYRLANLEQNIGMAWLQLSRFQEALGAFENGLATLSAIAFPDLLPSAEGKGRSSPATPKRYVNLRAMLLANKAATLLWLGEAAATPLFNEAHALFSAIGNEGYKALAEMYRAILAGQGGHVREALLLSRRSVAGLLAAGIEGYAALALLYRAEILLQLNRDLEADTAMSQAIELLRAGQSPHDLCLALAMRARILARRGLTDRSAYDAALACLEEGGRLSESVDYVGTRYHVALERAGLLLAMGRAAEAEEVALALYHASAVESELDRVRALVIAAEATFARGAHTLARTRAWTVIERGKAIGAPELQYLGQRMLARGAQREGAFEEALAHYDAAAVALGSTTADLVPEQRASFLQDKDAIYGEACLVALEAGAPARALAYLEQARAHALWRMRLGGEGITGGPAVEERTRATAREQEELDDIENLLLRHRALSASLRTTFADDPARADRVRTLAHLSQQLLERLAARAEREGDSEVLGGEALLARLPCQATAVAYALIEEALVTFVVADRRVVAVHRSAGGARQVRRLERELRLRIAELAQQGISDAQSLTAAKLARWTSGWQGTMQALWELLIAPVEPFLPPDGETLTLIPHHLLHALPLAALHDGARYLLERWVVRCVPSLQTLGAAPPQHSSPLGQHQVLALGYSDGGSLPQAAEQAAVVTRILGGTALIEGEASGTRLRAECGGRAYLHLSAHGEWRVDLPYTSYIQLADGPFHPIDALLLDLRGYRLVTLSACQTGTGQTSGGDAYIGLAQAFHEAGAEAVLATLWRVEAHATHAFLERFYEQLATGATPGRALRTAQLACLREPAGGLLASPYGWAGFQLTDYVLRPDPHR